MVRGSVVGELALVAAAGSFGWSLHWLSEVGTARDGAGGHFRAREQTVVLLVGADQQLLGQVFVIYPPLGLQSQFRDKSLENRVRYMFLYIAVLKCVERATVDVAPTCSRAVLACCEGGNEGPADL